MVTSLVETAPSALQDFAYSLDVGSFFSVLHISNQIVTRIEVRILSTLQAQMKGFHLCTLSELTLVKTFT